MKKWFVLLLFLEFVGTFGASYLFFKKTWSVAPVPKNLTAYVAVEGEKKEIELQKAFLRVLLVGDIMLGRSVNLRSLDMDNPNYPFEKVAERLRREDIVFANLESPIVENCPRIEHGYTFCADPKMAGGLTFAGVDIVSIANNHNMNFGKDGYEDTKKYLTDQGIKWVGDGNLEIIERGGVKFGFLGFDKSQQTFPKLSEGELELVKMANGKVDVLVVGMHWGVEYQNKALPGVRNLARELINNGADVVSGHHPHWVQDSELIDSVPVYYSLGNFIFDQMWSEETKKGLAVELTFDKTELIGREEFPTYMVNWAQPEWVD